MILHFSAIGVLKERAAGMYYYCLLSADSVLSTPCNRYFHASTEVKGKTAIELTGSRIRSLF